LRKVPGRASDVRCPRPGAPLPRRRKARTVIILGIILIVLGYLLPIPSIVVTIGWILLVVGLILTILGAVGRPVGRKTYF
jgi:membrane-bound ClpP family serine protease